MPIFSPKEQKLYSIIVSVFNEQDGIEYFWSELSRELTSIGEKFEVLFINDGSTDLSLAKIKHFQGQAEHLVKIISFSRNFGHEAAMIAGIDQALGDAIICLDADLQHPPSYIYEMLDEYKQGAHVVTMSRNSREDQKGVSRILSKLFYKIINRVSDTKFDENASDFFLISNRVANTLRNDYRERNRFLRGFIQSIGFNRSTIKYDAPKRVAGNSKYNIWALFKLTFHAVAAFSKAPLYLGLFFGLLFGTFSMILGIYTLVKFFVQDSIPSGYTTIVLFLSINFTILFFLIGIIGMYVGYNFDESKKRPIYLIDEIIDYKN